MRQIIDDTEEDDEGWNPDAMTPSGNSGLIIHVGPPIPGLSDDSLWPEAAHIFRLWQIYLDRVNPLTKIIHVPSLQPYVAEAASGTQNVPKNFEALLFSI